MYTEHFEGLRQWDPHPNMALNTETDKSFLLSMGEDTKPQTIGKHTANSVT